MSETHSAACKFCQLPVTLTVHPDAFEMFSMEIWLKLAACNRCADYHMRRNIITTAIQRLAIMARTVSQSFGDEERDQALSKCRSKLTDLTRKLATNAASHYRNGFTWESDWVEQLLTQPDKATMACTFYDRQHWKEWNKRRQREPEGALV